MIKYCSINGEIVPKENAVIGIDDLVITRGYGVFDFFRVINGHPVFLKDHLDRFYNSAKKLDLAVPYDRATLSQKIHQLVAVNELDACGIKVILTGGYSTDGFTPSTPNLLMTASILPTYPEAMYQKGVKLMSYQYTRDTPYTKSINYLVPIKIRKEIQEAEAFDVLYHDGQFVSESARSNFFIFDNEDVLITPDKDALEGITRKNVLQVAQEHFEVVIRPISLKETMHAKEAFMTSSTKGIMPVRQIDFWRINKGVIGNNTRKLMRLFAAHVQQHLSVATF